MIYIADMLKQLFVKILKHITTAKQTKQQISSSSQQLQNINRLLVNVNNNKNENATNTNNDKQQEDVNNDSNQSRKI